MNERIKELDQIAYSYAREKCPDYHGIQAAFSEKFAELIVNECADKCLTMAYVNPGPHHYAAMIKQHFGVEERPACLHNWVSAKNPVVQNGSVCTICSAIDAREPEELNNGKK